MAQTGTLRTWHDDRGYGFIAPTGGGDELFVHISAFPRDGSRPVVGETLTFELARGRDGKPAAVQVVRQALGKPSTYPSRRRTTRKEPAPWLGLMALLVSAGLIVAVADYVHGRYKESERRRELATRPATVPATLSADMSEAAPSGVFRCDGRTYCSQMTSCSEATFFINNCPGTKMDGNGDGVPCEQQWCTSPFAR